MPKARCSGQSGTTLMIATQFGLAMRRCAPIASALTSGTTSGTAPSMRNAEELSMTTVPLCTAGGAKRCEVALPAENSAMSVPASACPVRTCTGNASPR